MSGILSAVEDIAVIGALAVGGLAALSLRNLAPPRPAPFARPRPASSTALHTDHNATFHHDRGFLFRRRCWFTATGCPPLRVRAADRTAIETAQLRHPVVVARFNGRTWWLFEGTCYRSTADYSEQDVLALVRDRQRHHRTRLERAHRALRREQQPRRQGRAGLTQELKLAVWQRDGGRCVQCGSAFDLQYDHIIPVALGGATTEPNLQLLCSACNRAKGANL